MVNYKCIRCGYETNHKSKMTSHLNRKTVCKPLLNDIILDDYKEMILNCNPHFIPQKSSLDVSEIPQKSSSDTHFIPQKSSLMNDLSDEEDNICEFCEKKYSSKKNLWRHLKYNCKKKKKEEEEKSNLMSLVSLLNDQLKEQREQMNQIKKELDIKNYQIDELIKKSGITQNIQNNIKILAYKNTDISHLTDQDYIQCLNKSNMCIPQLIKKIHFNPEKPENHNVYISNIKNKYIMIYDGNKWNLNNQDEAIDDLIDANEFVLEQKLEEWIENGQDYPEIMRKFNRYLEKKEKDEVLNKIKEEIKLILFNNRKVIKE